MNRAKGTKGKRYNFKASLKDGLVGFIFVGLALGLIANLIFDNLYHLVIRKL